MKKTGLILSSLLFLSLLSVSVFAVSIEHVQRQPKSLDGDSHINSGKLIVKKSSGGGAAISPRWVWVGDRWTPQPLVNRVGQVIGNPKQLIVFDMNTRRIVPMPKTNGGNSDQSHFINPVPIDWYQPKYRGTYW